MTIFNSLGSNYKMRHISSMVGFNPFAPERLVEQLSEHFNKEAFLTYKGREALYLSIKRLNLPKNAKVAVNGYTCYAVYDAIVRAGAKPYYLDIEKDELNFSSKTLSQALKKDKDIKAVIVQNTLGTPADVNSIEDVCYDHKIPLIEDLAHSIGMLYQDGREAGTVGQSAALSFSQDKVVDAVSGGALLYKGEFSMKPKTVKYLKFFKDYYYIPNTLFIRWMYPIGIGKLANFVQRKIHFLPRPMDGDADDVRKPDIWHVTLALQRFDELSKDLAHRQRIAEIYRQNLPKTIQLKHFDESIYVRFPILIDNRASLFAHLKRKGIHVSDTWYEAVISPERCLKDTDYETGSCPQAEQVAVQMVNLPTHINVSPSAAERIAQEVNTWLSNQEK